VEKLYEGVSTSSMEINIVMLCQIYTRNCDELPESSQRAPRELPSPSLSEIYVFISLSKTADKQKI
jgi:hypothetical protein